MKKIFYALTLVSFLAISCSKDNNNNSNNNNNNNNNVDTSDAYIMFSVDGVTKTIGGTSNTGIGTSNGEFTEAFIGVGSNFSFFTIDFGRTNQSTVTGTDIINALNVKLAVQDFNDHSASTWTGIRGTIDNVFYQADPTKNSLPANYIKLTNVTYKETYNGEKFYTVRGEFNVNVNNGAVVKNLTNGKFKVKMQESL